MCNFLSVKQLPPPILAQHAKNQQLDRHDSYLLTEETFLRCNFCIYVINTVFNVLSFENQYYTNCNLILHRARLKDKYLCNKYITSKSNNGGIECMPNRCY